MKKLLFLLPLLFLITLPQLTYAESSGSESATVSPTPVAVDYTLPYPGLLPDSPLYVLKVFRDKVISFFISDPLKRSSFDVLQADKRLEGAYYLQKKGSTEEPLVETTVSKAGNYLDEAVQEAKQAKSMGEDTNAQLTTLHTALLKHQQVISQMMGSASSSFKQTMQRQLGRLKSLGKMVDTLSQE